MDKKENCISRALGHISACMTPIIPVLVAGGLLKIVILLLGYTPLFERFPDTEVILEAVSNAPFYFLPVMVACTSARHFDTDVVSGLAAVGTLLLPEFIALMERGNAVSFLGIPVYRMTYAYTVFPIIILMYLMSVFEHAMRKALKGVWRDIFLRLFVMAATALIGMLLIGPAVGTLSRGVLQGISWLQVHIPVLAWALFGATAPLQIVTGIHWVFVGLILQDLGQFGVESGFMAGYFMLTMSLTAVTLVAVKRSGDRKKRNEALTSLITIFFTGTSEPALYGICLTDRTALLAAMAGGLAGGVYQGLVTIHTYAYAFPTVFSILMFQSEKEPGNLLKAAVAGGISFVTAFVIMLAGYRRRGEKA